MNAEELPPAVQTVRDRPLEELITRSGLNGTVRFHEIIPMVSELKELLGYYNEKNVNALLPSRKQSLTESLGRTLTQLMAVQSEQNDTRPSQDQKRDIVKYFTNTHSSQSEPTFNSDRDRFWPLLLESTLLSLLQSGGQKDEGRRDGELAELLNAAKGAKENLDQILATAKQDLGAVGVSKHSKLFEEQAIEYERQGNNWLKWSKHLIWLNAGLICLTLIIVLCAEGVNKIEVGVSGALLVSLVSFGLVLCVRNYFAVKHNEIINRHKANCLGTYDTFVDSADEERKAMVLLQATQTIFSHQRSGYLSKEAEVSSPNPIVEVIRSIPTGKGG